MAKSEMGLEENLLLADGSAHKAYIRSFLSDGFLALDKLQKLDVALEHKDGNKDKHTESNSEAGYPSTIPSANPSQCHPCLSGLGPEKASKLLAASCAEPSLLSAVYWVVCAHALLGETLPPTLVQRSLDFVLACRHNQSGGFSPHPAHEPHVLATLSAVQLLLLLGRRDLLFVASPESCEDIASSDLAKQIVHFVFSLRLADGSWRGRRAEAAEGDCRFVYAAMCTLALLNAAEKPAGDLPCRASLTQTSEWLLRCQNLDGGFGCRPDGECESHAGHAFCCLASLTLAGSMSALNERSCKRLLRWLCDRQCPEGGLNGRPGKAPDACYTWWTLSSAQLMLAGTSTGKSSPAPIVLQDLFQMQPIRDFVAQCSSSSGGVAAHPGDDPDPFHTLFGLAGLSLAISVDRGPELPWLGRISPLVALPEALVPSELESAASEGRSCVSF